MPSFTPATPPTLEYARPAGRMRRWRALRPSVVIAMIGCGGAWVVAPCLSAAWVLAARPGGGGDFPDSFMALLIVTALCGLVLVLFAVFRSARRPRRHFRRSIGSTLRSKGP